MNAVIGFGIEFVISVVACVLVFLYLRRALQRVLVEICGGEERARFWTHFSAVILIGAPAAAALGYNPTFGYTTNPFFGIMAQLERNLFGLLIAVMALGFVMGFFAVAAPRAPRGNDS